MKSASSVVEGSGAGIERSIITDEETNLRFIILNDFQNKFFIDYINNKFLRSDEEIGLFLKNYRVINLLCYCKNDC